ncbi:hypothetical protein NDU88_003129 [Pleurodeles waltl]|uniref:Uncharacterized protein n=1 Tax=Pleurodeles waltl TaxID=8319 RepID=A0AAV7LHN5_PLEWA|nr:hypothetical protein NDU88_003129 [Pleurodeles waltl]
MDTRSTRVLFIPAAFRSAYVRERDPRVGAADKTGNRAKVARVHNLIEVWGCCLARFWLQERVRDIFEIINDVANPVLAKERR